MAVAIQVVDQRLDVRFGSHANEREAARAPCRIVDHHTAAQDSSKLRAQVLESGASQVRNCPLPATSGNLRQQGDVRGAASCSFLRGNSQGGCASCHLGRHHSRHHHLRCSAQRQVCSTGEDLVRQQAGRRHHRRHHHLRCPDHGARRAGHVDHGGGAHGLSYRGPGCPGVREEARCGAPRNLNAWPAHTVHGERRRSSPQARRQGRLGARSSAEHAYSRGSTSCGREQRAGTQAGRRVAGPCRGVRYPTGLAPQLVGQGQARRAAHGR